MFLVSCFSTDLQATYFTSLGTLQQPFITFKRFLLILLQLWHWWMGCCQWPNRRMRLWLVSVFVLLSLVSVCQGQSFLDNVRNIFNRLNPFRPQQSSSSTPRPRPRPTPAAPVFRPRPASSAPLRVAPSPSFDSPPPRPANFNFGRLNIQPIATPGRGNHNYEGRTYLLSWKEGQTHFSWQQARDWCASNGMRIISLDDPAKRDHFLSLTASEGVEFFWTGGIISSDKKTLTWENGFVEGISQGVHPWSFAGLRGPQPDGQGSEDCLAILNNLYDVSTIFSHKVTETIYLLRMVSNFMMWAAITIKQQSVKTNQNN